MVALILIIDSHEHAAEHAAPHMRVACNYNSWLESHAL